MADLDCLHMLLPSGAVEASLLRLGNRWAQVEQPKCREVIERTQVFNLGLVQVEDLQRR